MMIVRTEPFDTKGVDQVVCMHILQCAFSAHIILEHSNRIYNTKLHMSRVMI